MRGYALVLVLVAGVLPSDASAAVLRWSTRLAGCEPPSTFYSPSHRPGARPCCATEPGICPGGLACPPSGVCPTDGVTCQTSPAPSRPNIVLFISDDQAECAWGSAGECRSTQSGTPIPPPVTPNLDLLAGYGTVFPVAHNTSAWCFPSLNTIVTGRYQKSFGGNQRVAALYPTLFKVTRSLNHAPGTRVDPYEADNAVGGYCTFLGGKFGASIGDPGEDAITTSRRLDRTLCTDGDPGQPPRCGTNAEPGYSPTTVFQAGDEFAFLEHLIHPAAGGGGRYAVTPFFLWHAPRLPHAPLNAPQPIMRYLFGAGDFPLGGAMDLGRYCGPNGCAPTVDAFNEVNIGRESNYYGNVWWTDDSLRELRVWLAHAGATHCVGGDGLGRYDLATPGACANGGGTWASQVPDLRRNTVFIYLSDNGWFLPNSKHTFSENGHRTRLMVYDPRALPTLPPDDGQGAPPLPPRESDAVVASADVLPTVLGYALGTPGAQPCPTADDGTTCDGKDLRPFLYDVNGVAAQPPEQLRHALCGHETQKGVVPTNQRYLVTRAGSVGRCTDLAGAACSTAAECGAGRTCLGGHCIADVQQSCAAGVPCPSGMACLGGQCVAGPSCIDDAACGEILGPGAWSCAEAAQKWCRNAPDVRCGQDADCPVCTGGPGPTPAPCKRKCEPRRLKLYVAPGAGGTPSTKLTDLFTDPDENGLERLRPGSLVSDLSRSGGPYQGTMARLDCCVDQWWPAIVPQTGTLCTGACPSNFSCVQ
jgi:hypothetical protein